MILINKIEISKIIAKVIFISHRNVEVNAEWCYHKFYIYEEKVTDKHWR